MKRWSTDRSGWARVPRQETGVKQVGCTTLVHLRALEVREPLTVTCCGEQVKIMDVGYLWLTIYEEGAHHITTAHCNANGEPVHWYTDIVASWGFDANGFPCFDDLCLDVIALPDRQVEIIDGDELKAASKTHVINPRTVRVGVARGGGCSCRCPGGIVCASSAYQGLPTSVLVQVQFAANPRPPFGATPNSPCYSPRQSVRLP